MTEQTRVLRGERDGTIERQAGRAIIVFAALALFIKIKLAALLGLRVGFVDNNPVAIADALSGAGESPALWAVIALLLGCCVCARRDRGRTQQGNPSQSTRRV